MISPRLSEYNFRPTGHFFYRVLEAAAGLDYRWWVLGLWILHGANCALLWLLMRQAEVDPLAAVAGLVFFAFHPATFDAYWRSMYVFDVLCATFSLASVLAYIHRRWVLSWLCFWVAFKAKELAIMLPVVLLLWEYTRGERRWMRLLPFAAVSGWFGAQAAFRNAPSGDYSFRFTWEAVAETGKFYFYQIFRNFGIAAILLLTPFAVRDRRLGFGIASAGAIMLPLLFLPGRIFAVYTYVALAFAGYHLASIADRWRWSRIAAPAVMLLIWSPVMYGKLRQYRASTLAAADDNRKYVETVRRDFESFPETEIYLLDGRPAGMKHWGPPGALSYVRRGKHYKVAALDDEGRKLIGTANAAVLAWRPVERRLDVVRIDKHEAMTAWIDVRTLVGAGRALSLGRASGGGPAGAP
jgi:hypothetical protein